MVLFNAQAYFKTAFNSRSIVEGGSCQIFHCRLHQKPNLSNDDFKTPDYY